MKSVTIPCHYKYEEEYLPPRCRIPRYRETEAVHSINIPVVAPKDAPIAFKHLDHIVGVTPDSGSRYYGSVKVYRVFNGKLYTRIPASDKYCGATGWWKFSQLKKEISERQTWSCVSDWDVGCLHEPSACEAHFDKKFSKYLIIQSGGKKQIWEEASEPMYVIHTFGLGHNHGGTSFSITDHYNPNIRKDCYFNALQAKEGMKEALRIAKGRGDTNYLSLIRKHPVIKVLMPEMVTRNPQKEHGDGDPFTNELEGLCNGSSSTMEAGLLTILHTMASITK